MQKRAMTKSIPNSVIPNSKVYTLNGDDEKRIQEALAEHAKRKHDDIIDYEIRTRLYDAQLEEASRRKI